MCIDCKHFSLKAAEHLAEHGFGRCELERNKARFHTARFERQCDDFRKGGDGDRGRAWLANKQLIPPQPAA